MTKKTKTQRIAIASEGKDKDSEISLRGGRAPYYLIFEDKKFIEAQKMFVIGSAGDGGSV